jgi:hypothetical protein
VRPFVARLEYCSGISRDQAPCNPPGKGTLLHSISPSKAPRPAPYICQLSSVPVNSDTMNDELELKILTHRLHAESLFCVVHKRHSVYLFAFHHVKLQILSSKITPTGVLQPRLALHQIRIQHTLYPFSPVIGTLFRALYSPYSATLVSILPKSRQSPLALASRARAAAVS